MASKVFVVNINYVVGVNVSLSLYFLIRLIGLYVLKRYEYVFGSYILVF